MSTQLSPVETTVAPFAGGADGSWIDRLQELVAPILIEDRIVVEPDDPVGGGAPCQIAGMPAALSAGGPLFRPCAAMGEGWPPATLRLGSR
jgi:hypothetical protein